VLRGGRVMDPESGLDEVRDVGIREGKVAALSEAPLAGGEVVDASGLVVAPGFIDLHQHGQNTTSHALHVRDGVTTALDLEAGAWRVAPFYAEREGKTPVNYGVSVGHIAARVKLMHGFEIGHRPTSAGRQQGLSGAFMRLVERFYRPMGYARDAATPDQIEELVGLLAGGLDEGALGIGMGLDYTPGATAEEIHAVFALAAARGVPVFVHMKGAIGPDDMSQIDALLAQVEDTRAALHIFHLGSSGGPRAAAYLERIAAARARGLDVTSEVYPYTASSTYLESAMFDDGWQERLGIGYGDLQWAATGERLTAETFAKYREEGGMVIAHGMRREWVDPLVTNPEVMIASDGMPFFEEKVHPRGAGTFARVLGRYVREQRALTLMDALRKMTLLPAQRLEGFAPPFRDKGRVRVGADADLTVFDPSRVNDRATFEDPWQPSAGIVQVLVGGVLVVRGETNVPDVFPGRGMRARAAK
jgi:dihydroorotase